MNGGYTMKNRLIKRVLAFMLSVVLLLSNIPAAVFAVDEELPTEKVVEETIAPTETATEETTAPTVAATEPPTAETEPPIAETEEPTQPAVPEETVTDGHRLSSRGRKRGVALW